MEYLEWCEDMGLEPIVNVYAGASLDPFSLNMTNSVPEDQMQPVLQEALDELEYITGDTSTPWGALRAQHGHPEPFEIRSGPSQLCNCIHADMFADSSRLAMRTSLVIPIIIA